MEICRFTDRVFTNVRTVELYLNVEAIIAVTHSKMEDASSIPSSSSDDVHFL
jgi:hypothetical protein